MEKELEKKLYEESILTDLDNQIIENPLYFLAEKLKEKGYDISGHATIRVKEKLPSNFIGILKDREPLQRNFFGIKYNKTKRALHLGTLWTNNIEKGAYEDKNWVMEFYGKKDFQKLKKVIKDISSEYNVKVEFNLKSNIPKREGYLSDFY